MRTLQDSHVVITGGTGALGSAVAKALVGAGAHCHVPAIETAVPADRFPKDKVSVTTSIDLSDEPAVSGFYAKLPPIHAVVSGPHMFDESSSRARLQAASAASKSPRSMSSWQRNTCPMKSSGSSLAAVE